MANASQDATVDKPSAAYEAMLPAWTLISDIVAGAAAVRAKGELYLPKYEDETRQEYERRKKSAPWRPEFVDVLRSLASKPFGKDVALDEKTSQRIKDLAEDIDARGNSLTAFARSAFREGIADGLHGILVDFPSMSSVMTLADEKASGVRPYWLHVCADDIIALYTDIIDGVEKVTHVRIKECVIVRDGFGEREVNRVRVLFLDALNKPQWQLWEQQNATNTVEKPKYVMIGEGPITLDAIPLVLFWTGERKGEHFVIPPLLDLADMQIELYRAQSRLDEILTFAGSPMLAANGFTLPEGQSVAVGPKRIMVAPPGMEGGNTSWSFIQPAAGNIKEVRDHVQSVIDDIRRLGMQPLTPKSGTPTATGQSIEAAKAHSAVQAWALDLQDALEQAFVYTAQWLKEDSAIEVTVDVDFSIEPYAPAPLQTLQAARAAKDITIETYWAGLRRFDVLPADFDADAEAVALADELAGLQADVPIDPVTGQEIITPAAPAPKIGSKTATVA
ncbi:DUF4055 domain-containing protein [Mesorhizobium sp. M2D.F.Ca.ET.145.01.1.1]|uniref:DUF4055 domain-containing protein n=1 Tax=unclassified Mesorhizobium TaxID=325217 RepID=UPI000FCBB557|nr:MULTISPECIES: DUF4055 domain-containing protein [unclassified Mesorhizobium]TGU44647.1 DUF4055 domain-containing protein [bacterium M00.F.Ca.ET.146.01.1.1]TGU58475.1 DUF4055 domain-containing protein [Mesorhizobium sp. M2D.F.Ca.ET.148.01.1.1]TGU64407.1 DUF4055 domain-containing protein [Mesorhizobium sp. M2D.F.Ca.ET.147.01.1.1]TGW09983.1 DUF4055 domain-containing protein [Mesorhizobium sp. M2D.F.Ca.ET.145.01.1.1]